MTLIGQMVTFFIFVMFTMYFVWPPMEKALEDRKLKISEGLLAADKGHKILQDAEISSKKNINDTKILCESLISSAKKQADGILESVKLEALNEKNSIINSANSEIEKSINQARSELRDQFAGLVIMGSEKILSREVKVSDHVSIINNLSKELK